MFTHVTLRACSLALFSAELKVAIISQETIFNRAKFPLSSYNSRLL